MSFCEDKGRERLYKRVMAARVTKGWSKYAIQKIQNAKILKYKKYRNTLYNSARQYCNGGRVLDKRWFVSEL